MNARILAVILGFCALITVPGCGTVGNHIPFGSNWPELNRVYGGVRFDLQAAAEEIQKTRDKNDHQLPLLILVGTPFLLVDVPLCAVADTILLPWDLARSISLHKGNSEDLSIASSEPKHPAHQNIHTNEYDGP